MSIRAMMWAFDRDDLDCGIKFTLVALAEFADESNTCYPGQATLARMTGQDERTIRRHVVKLAELGLLARRHRPRADGRGRTSDRYTLAVDGPLPDTVSGRKSAVLPDTGDVLPDTDVVSTGHHARGTVREPLVEPSDSPPKKPRARNALFDALVEAFHLDPGQITAGAGRGIGKVAAELKAVGATPEEIRLRAKRYVTAHPTWEATPHALAKHWADPELCGAAEHDDRNWWDN